MGGVVVVVVVVGRVEAGGVVSMVNRPLCGIAVVGRDVFRGYTRTGRVMLHRG